MLPCLIFEDEHLLVVNKPAGLNTHAPSPYAGEGLYDWLRQREPRWASLAIIHRLDKETSGVLVFAKTPQANRSLTEQFTQRQVHKKYLLLTDRQVRQPEFTVRSSLVRVGEKYVSRPGHAGGQPAETRFRSAECKVQSAECGTGTLLEAEPLTGRTHQIRVHAAEKGFPILGDTLYGGSPAPRVCLHAAEITFRHPASGQPVTYRAPVDFEANARLALRTACVEPDATNACRIIHGASDGWPGWYVDRLGDYLLSQSEAALNAAQEQELRRRLKELPAQGAYHKRLTRQVRKTSLTEASPQLVAGTAAPERFTIRENGLEFEMSFGEGYSVGLFLDQRDNRRRLLTGHIGMGFPLSEGALSSPTRPVSSPPLPVRWGEGRGEGPFTPHSPLPTPHWEGGQGEGVEVLNTFAYTCGFSVCAAKAGARTTSLDLSKKYLDWGKRNFALNQMDPAGHDFIYGDVFDWMRRLGKKGRRYDVILLDPPTFSQSKESGVFRAERDYGKLVESALPLLKPGGVLLASTNAAEWPPEQFLASVAAACRVAQRRIRQQLYAPQPPDFPISRAEPAYLKTVWLRVE